MKESPPEEWIDVIDALEHEVRREEQSTGAAILPARKGLVAARARLAPLDATGVLVQSEGQYTDE